MRSNAELVAGLRGLADYLERHPGLGIYANVTIHEFCGTAEALAAIAREHAPLVKKAEGDVWYCVSKQFGPSVKIEWNIEREKVCRKEVVSREMVTIPAEPAKPEREVEVVKTRWVCNEPILARQAEADDLRAKVEALPVTDEIDLSPTPAEHGEPVG